MDFIGCLPLDIESEIIEFLSPADLGRMSMVCSRYRYCHSFTAESLFTTQPKSFFNGWLKITCVPLPEELCEGDDYLFMMPYEGYHDGAMIISHQGMVSLLVFSILCYKRVINRYGERVIRSYYCSRRVSKSVMDCMEELGFTRDRCVKCFQPLISSYHPRCGNTHWYDSEEELSILQELKIQAEEVGSIKNLLSVRDMIVDPSCSSEEYTEEEEFEFEESEGWSDESEDEDEDLLEAIQLEHDLNKWGETYFEVMRRGEWDDEELFWCIGQFGF